MFCKDDYNMSLYGVQVYGEASIIFPLLVAETFARNWSHTKDTSGEG